jgi:HAD superfamily hydrolase (TIGR01458 family)
MARGLLLDVDGVLMTSERPLAGAAECVEWLQEHRVEFRLVTNTSSRSRREIAAALALAGMSVDPARIHTAVTAAARYLVRHHRGRECYIVNEGDLSEDLGGIRAGPPGSADVVLLGGAGPSTGFVELNHAFRLAVTGVPVVALHRNTHYETVDGPVLDMGAFLPGLEAAAGIDVPLVGKPAAAFFRAALADLGLPPGATLMVGDDIGSDVLGAQGLGMVGVLVRTGKFRPSDLVDVPALPDHVIGGIGELPGLLQSMTDWTG